MAKKSNKKNATKKDSNIVNINLSASAKKELEALVYLTGKSRRDLCKIAVDEYLKKNNKYTANVVKEFDKFNK